MHPTSHQTFPPPTLPAGPSIVSVRGRRADGPGSTPTSSAPATLARLMPASRSTTSNIVPATDSVFPLAPSHESPSISSVVPRFDAQAGTIEVFEVWLHIVNQDTRRMVRSAVERRGRLSLPRTGPCNSQPELTEAEMATFRLDIIHAAKINTFLLHSSANNVLALQMVFKDRVSQDDAAWMQGRTCFLDNSRQFKQRVIEATKIFITALFAREPSSKVVPTVDVPFDHHHYLSLFEPLFNQTNYYACFPYVHDIIEFATSTGRGQFFMRKVFVNICMATCEWMLVHNATRGPGKDKTIGRMYDNVAVMPEFDDIDLWDFQLVSRLAVGGRQKRKRGDQEEPFVAWDIGPSPPKQMAHRFSREQRLDPELDPHSESVTDLM